MELPGDPLILIDAADLPEIAFVREAEGPIGEIISAGEPAYDIVRQGKTATIEIRLNSLQPGRSHFLTIYGSPGRLSPFVATLSNPRCHLPVRIGAQGAMSIFEIYEKGGKWRLKADAGQYSGGLSALLRACGAGE